MGGKFQRIFLTTVVGLGTLVGQTSSFTVVSAASYQRDAALAAEMIATGFSAAIVAPLAGYSVSVRDAAGAERAAPLFGVASGQISFLVPGGTAQGDAAITLRSGDRVLGVASVRIATVSPGVFTANASGAGAPAAFALMVSPDGARTNLELFQSATGGGFLPRPFSIGADQVYLLLFGTGLRGWRTAATAVVGGKTVPVAGPVAQGMFDGLDQVNLGPLPASLADRRGELEVALTVDGAAANRVRVAPNLPALGEWGTRGNLIEPNSEYTVAALDGKIYVLGGYPANRQTQSTVQVYDPVEDRWELATPMPIALNHNMAASVDGKLYMIGGQTTDTGAGNFSDGVFEYDPATREWRERSRMPTARGAGVAVVVDGKIYVAGGRPPRGADFAVYDPRADSWRTLPDLPTQRNHLAGGALGGKVYIVGGRFEAGFQSPQRDAVEAYNPETNTWSTRARMPKPRGGLNGVEAYGCLHVFGGEGNAGGPNGLYPDHDVYNPVTDSWTSLGPMPIPVHGVTGAAFLSGLIYLPGGGTSQGGSSGSLHHQVFRPNMVCR